MEHDAIRHKLSEYIDGSLTADERNAVEEHLGSCSLCSNALQELRKTVEHIKNVEEVDPPAWMTKQIMANVRDASKQRKGFLTGWFLPLSMKLPIQTVAILFLVVTAFYLYRNMPSTIKPAAEQLQESAAKKDVPPAGIGKNALGKANESAARPLQVPQSPAYKALDMKPEYEKSAPPIPQDHAGTPAPLKQDEGAPFAKKEAAGKRQAAATQPGAPPLSQEQAAIARMRAEVTSTTESQARIALNAAQAEKDSPAVMLHVNDIEIAGRDVEQALTKLGGSITRKASAETSRIYRVTIDAQKLPQLKHMLKLIGEMRYETAPSASRSGRVALTIEIMKNQTLP